MFQCSVILSMKLTFLQLLHIARWLLHFQTHGVIQGRKKKTRCHSGRACVALAKAKLSGNPQQHSAYVLLLRTVMKSTVKAVWRNEYFSWAHCHPKELRVLLVRQNWRVVLG